MQVEPPRRRERRKTPGERTDRLAGLECHYFRQMRIVRYERGHGLLGNEDEPGVGVSGPQHSHEGGGQQDVADGGEADEKETRHAKKV